MTRWTAGGSVRTHLRILRGCGYCRGAPDTATHRAYRALVLAATLAYLAQECVYAYRERADMDKLARVMFLLLCHVTAIVKQFVFVVDADRIDRIIAALDEPSYNGREARSQAALSGTGAGAARFVVAYSGTAALTCTLWIVFPALDRARGRPVEFPFWVWFRYDSSFGFSVMLLYSYYVTTLVGVANTTMDAFIATVLNQCKTQLTILRMNFEDLMERARAQCGGVGDSDSGGDSDGDSSSGGSSPRRFERALDRLFLDCLAHYGKIYETAGLLLDVFGFAILVQFGIGGWILCMAAYKIVSLSVLSVEFASMTLFISCILTELFLYCYYGNAVTVESSLVSQSAYSMRWLRAPPRFQRALLVLGERARRPLRPVAGRVIPLSLETFLKIIKSSYTFYAVLRQTK